MWTTTIKDSAKYKPSAYVVYYVRTIKKILEGLKTEMTS